jgi:hypothetical protein
MGTDAFVEVANGGWRIDTVSVTAGARVCCAGGGSSAPASLEKSWRVRRLSVPRKGLRE